MVTISYHSNELTTGMCISGLMSVSLLYFAFPFIFNYTVMFFMQGNHTKALIFHIDTNP